MPYIPIETVYAGKLKKPKEPSIIDKTLNLVPGAIGVMADVAEPIVKPIANKIGAAYSDFTTKNTLAFDPEYRQTDPTSQRAFINPTLEKFNNPATSEDERIAIREQVKNRNIEKDPILTALNSETGKKITGQIYSKTENLPLKAVARLQSLGDSTYEEAKKNLEASWGDPQNQAWQRWLYGVQNSGVQSAIGVLLALGAGVISRNPTVGTAVASSYFAGVSAEAQRKEKGRVESLGNIAIDTVGDTMLSGLAETVLKTSVKSGFKNTIKNMAKGFATEGGTEVAQAIGVYANDYANATSDQERNDVVADLKNYVKSGAMLDEFMIGGLSGATITGVTGAFSPKDVNIVEPKGASEKKEKEFTLPEPTKVPKTEVQQMNQAVKSDSLPVIEKSLQEELTQKEIYSVQPEMRVGMALILQKGLGNEKFNQDAINYNLDLLKESGVDLTPAKPLQAATKPVEAPKTVEKAKEPTKPAEAKTEGPTDLFGKEVPVAEKEKTQGQLAVKPQMQEGKVLSSEEFKAAELSKMAEKKKGQQTIEKTPENPPIQEAKKDVSNSRNFDTAKENLMLQRPPEKRWWSTEVGRGGINLQENIQAKTVEEAKRKALDSFSKTAQKRGIDFGWLSVNDVKIEPALTRHELSQLTEKWNKAKETKTQKEETKKAPEKEEPSAREKVGLPPVEMKTRREKQLEKKKEYKPEWLKEKTQKEKVAEAVKGETKTQKKPAKETITPISDEEFNSEAGAEVWQELQTAEAGKRITLKQPGEIGPGETVGIIGQKSSFPAWIPSKLRHQKLINHVLKHLNERTVPEKGKAVIELYKIARDEITQRNQTKTNSDMAFKDNTPEQDILNDIFEEKNSIKTKAGSAVVGNQSIETDRSAIEDFGEKIGGAKKENWSKRGLEASDLLEMNEREIAKHLKKDNIWFKNYDKMAEDGVPPVVIMFNKRVRDSINPKVQYTSRDTTPELKKERDEEYINFVTSARDSIQKIRTIEDITNFFNNFLYQNGFRDSAGYTEKARNSLVLTRKFIRASRISSNWELHSLESDAKKEQFGVPAKDKLLKGVEIRLDEKTNTYYVAKDRGHFGQIYKSGFTTKEEATTWAKENLKKKEKKQGKQRFVPVQLESIHRKGLNYRPQENITGKDYLDVFGFKGGEFGNWMTEKDRQISLNYGFDALMDLADALKIDPKNIAFDNTLSIAFGSRGVAGAVAHYEPDRNVFNLTKMRGAGSTAHEWWHGLEDYLLTKFGKEKIESLEKLKTTLKEKPASESDVKEFIAESEKNAKKKLEVGLNAEVGASSISKLSEEKKVELEKIKEDMRQGNTRAVFDLGIFVKKNFNRKFINGSYLEFWTKRIKDKNITPPKTVDTQYFKDAKYYSQNFKKEKGYWESSEEMLARAFASFITDKTQGNSDYLSGHSEYMMPDEDGKIRRIMPFGEERISINAAFEELFADLKKRGVFTSREITERPEISYREMTPKEQQEMERFEKYPSTSINELTGKLEENLPFKEKRVSTEEAIKEFRRYFPESDVKLEIVKKIVTDKGSLAWGSSTKNLVRFIKNPLENTASHEAVHHYIQLFLSKKDYNNLIKYVKKYKLRGDLSPKAVEEWMGENFNLYVKEMENIKIKKSKDNVIKRIFDAIINEIKKFIGKEDLLNKFYKKIYNVERPFFKVNDRVKSETKYQEKPQLTTEKGSLRTQQVFKEAWRRIYGEEAPPNIIDIFSQKERGLFEKGAHVSFVEGKKIQRVTSRETIIQNRQKNLAKIKEIKAKLRTEFKKKTANVQSIKQQIVDYVNENVPPKDRGKYLVAVKNAKTELNLIRVINKIDARRIAYERKLLVKSIVNITENIDKLPVEFQKTILGITDQIELKHHTERLLRRLRKTRAYLDTLENDFTMPRRVLNELGILKRTPFEQVSNEKLIEINNKLKQYNAVGRSIMKNRKVVKVMGTKQALDEILKQKDLKNLDVISLERKLNPFFKKEIKMSEKWKEKFSRSRMNLMGMDRFFNLLDGRADYQGANFKTFKEPVDTKWNEWQYAEDQFRKTFDNLIRDLNLTKDNSERIAIHAYREQRGGREKLLKDLKMTEDQLDSVKLTEQEMQVYQWMRKQLDKLYPQLSEYLAKEENIILGKPENYFPMMQDYGVTEDLKDEFQKEGRLKAVPFGNKEERANNASQRLKLDAFQVFDSYVGKATYFMNMNSTIKQLNKIVDDPRYVEMVGEDAKKIIKDWLQVLARKGGAIQKEKRWETRINDLNNNLTVAMLGIRLTTIAKQPLALLDGAAEIGSYAFMGTRMVLDKNNREFMFENSSELRNRAGGETAIQEMEEAPTKSKVKEAAMYPIKFLDIYTAGSVWLGAYQQKLDELGVEFDRMKPNKEAMKYADLVVRKTQASGAFKDLPPALVNEYRFISKLLFKFQTFVLNRWSYVSEDLPDKMKNNKKLAVQQVSFLALSMMLETGISSLYYSMMFGDDDDDETGIVQKTLLGMLASAIQTVPGLSQVFSATKYDSNPVPIIEATNDFFTSMKQVFTAKKAETKAKNATRNLSIGLGLYYGIPTEQARALLEKLIFE